MRVFEVSLAAVLIALPVNVQAQAEVQYNVEIEEITITAKRLPPTDSDAPFAVTVLGQGDLEALPALRLDEALRYVPGAGLFRRASSLVAHPTTQGITLRGLGPNGAGRALVSLDGVPQNDPFGGWVYWSALSSAELAAVRITRGAGAGRWGAGALSGVIELESAPIGESGGDASLSYGSRSTVDGSASVSFGNGRSGARISGGYFKTAGHYLLGAGQRGNVDEKASSDAARISAELRHDLGGGTTLDGTVRYFEESRVNGLALSTNETDALDISLGLVHRANDDGPDWQVGMFYKNRDFANSFASVSSVVDLRDSTRIVLDQFDVPAEGFGANGLVRLKASESTDIEAGFDVRRMSGETNEHFRNLGAGFTRLRLAGGDEMIAGAYLEATHRLGPATRLTAGVRIDHWRAFDGVRTESDLADGAILRDDAIADRAGWVPSARLGLEHDLKDGLSLRAAAYSGFRVPTINELYRPFRVRNDITEANPLLEPERVYGFDIGFRAAPTDEASFEIGYFRNWLNDGIGNVTLALGPGFFPPTGFVPAGGSLRQRRNIDHIVSDGLEVSGTVKASDALTLTARYLYVNSRVTSDAVAPELSSKKLAGVAKHQFSFVADYAPDGPFRASAALRYVSDQFDDDLNARVLDGFILASMRAEYALRQGITVQASVENLFDAEIQSALSGDGLLTLAQPRLWRIGLELSY